MKLLYFALTLRKTSKKVLPTKDMYWIRLHYLEDKLPIVISHVVFENTAGLHCHATLSMEEETYSEAFMLRFRCRGWKTHLVPVTFTKGWADYCDKDQIEDDILDDDNFHKISINLFKVKAQASIPTLSPALDLQTFYDQPDEGGVTQDDYRDLAKFNLN